jgi:hypothetical protein
LIRTGDAACEATARTGLRASLWDDQDESLWKMNFPIYRHYESVVQPRFLKSGESEGLPACPISSAYSWKQLNALQNQKLRTERRLRNRFVRCREPPCLIDLKLDWLALGYNPEVVTGDKEDRVGIGFRKTIKGRAHVFVCMFHKPSKLVSRFDDTAELAPSAFCDTVEERMNVGLYSYRRQNLSSR